MSVRPLQRQQLCRQSSPAPPPSGRPGAVWRRKDDSVEGRAFIDGDVRWLIWEHLGVFQFQVGHETVNVWPDADVSDDALHRAFARDVGAVIFEGLSLGEAMHASAAIGPHGAVVLCGMSGAGKSTTAYALGQRPGWRHAADDQVLLSFAEPTPMVLTQSFTTSLRPMSRAHFGAADTSEVPSDGLPAAVPVVAIVVLEQSPTLDAPWRASHISAADAFTAILPHAHCFEVNDEAATRRFVARYFHLITSTPVVHVTYRPSFDHLPAMTEMLAALPGVPSR